MSAGTMRKLLMIPGPIEISPAVVEATSGAPPSHVAPDFIEAFGHALTAMRKVWLAPDDHQPFAIAGSGTIAMEMAATNLIGPGDRVLLVNTGYFGDRIAKMLRRRGAMVEELRAPAGSAPSVEAAAAPTAVPAPTCRAWRRVSAVFLISLIPGFLLM